MVDLDYNVEKTAALRKKYPSASSKAARSMAASMQESSQTLEALGQAVETLLHPRRCDSQECAELERSVKELNYEQTNTLVKLQSATELLHNRKALVGAFIPAAPLEESERANRRALEIINERRSALLGCCQACKERALCPRLARMNMDMG
jgi:hypothetical protein